MEELLTIKEVAAKLKISSWTIRAWCSQKFIPYFKLRGSVRFREREVELWLKKNISLGRSVRRPSEVLPYRCHKCATRAVLAVNAGKAVIP
jgi:excisionase family DNA binding protein